MWRSVAWLQSGYFVTTGLWPVLHMPSFLAVTGPKTDLWLVRLIGGVIALIGIVIADAAWKQLLPRSVIALGIGSAAMLLLADLLAFRAGVVGAVYLWDAALETVVIILWGIVIQRLP